MRTLAHVFVTWIVANLIHPFMLMAYFYLRDNEEVGMGDGNSILMMFLFSTVISFPSLFIGWGLLSGILRLDISKGDKLFFWVLASVITILINFLGILLLVDGRIYFDEVEIIIPSAVAVIISILARYNQFIRLNNYKKSLV